MKNEHTSALCPACGSDCNERDELEKAEREINRLRAAPQQAEPVGYFVNDESDDQWHQVDYEQRNGADTYPLYLHPPADEVQQAKPCDVCDVCNALTVPRNATRYDADDLKAAQVRGKIIAARLQQQAEPVAQIGWSDEFGNLFPMAAWKPAQRTHHDAHKTAWRPVFLHPPAAEVQKLRDAVSQLCTIVRIPNAEHIADEHNAAVAFLRRALERV